MWYYFARQRVQKPTRTFYIQLTSLSSCYSSLLTSHTSAPTAFLTTPLSPTFCANQHRETPGFFLILTMV